MVAGSHSQGEVTWQISAASRSPARNSRARSLPWRCRAGASASFPTPTGPAITLPATGSMSAESRSEPLGRSAPTRAAIISRSSSTIRASRLRSTPTWSRMARPSLSSGRAAESRTANKLSQLTRPRPRSGRGLFHVACQLARVRGNMNLALPWPRPRRPFEQRTRLHFKNRREFVDHIDGCAVYASFQCADIGAIDLSLVGQRLLRQSFGVARLAQIAGEDLSYVHVREATVLSCISPRSMLDNRNFTAGYAKLCTGSYFHHRWARIARLNLPKRINDILLKRDHVRKHSREDVVV